MAGGHARTLEEGWHGEEVEGPQPVHFDHEMLLKWTGGEGKKRKEI